MQLKADGNLVQPTLVIIVPCYNEAERLPVNEFVAFLNDNLNISVCFVNDGSKDSTDKILNQIKEVSEVRVHILSNDENVGKAESVRRGMLYCADRFNFDSLAYLDADLATSLQECLELSKYLNDEISFCFGSRIMRIGSVIERSYMRHIIGRILATFISGVLKLRVYDTQCGCKIIKTDLAIKLFQEPFISKWLFDVELFARIINIYGRPDCISRMIEIPLNKWTEKGGSKVKITYAFKLWFDLLRINRKYRSAL
jgi:glycosyltransferase involved in cell wall biosynthesis